MRADKANHGDDGCPWGVAAAAHQRPFFGGPIRCGLLVDSSQFVCTFDVSGSRFFCREFLRVVTVPAVFRGSEEAILRSNRQRPCVALAAVAPGPY